VSGLTGITAIAGGGAHSLALKNDGMVWAWGWNLYGQLGNGTNTDSNVPVQVSSLTDIIAIAAGWEHSVALKNDGTLWAWGWNTYGELGDGTNGDSNVPVQVSSVTAITAISGGESYSLAMKNDSTVWAWGYNYYGQLGNGTNTDSNVPVQVSSLTGIIAIAGGRVHSLALKNDGTVWAWGYNADGQLGNGTNADSNVPVQVSSLTGIIAIAGGREFHSLALKNDGTVWAWGDNYYGEIGNGSNTNSNVPVQVTGLCQVATAVNEVIEPLSISVFPNPVQTQLTINLATPANEVSIRVYDLSTRLSEQGRMIALPTTFTNAQAQLNTTGLADGFYMLRIINNKTGECEVAKFMKQQ